MLDWNNMVVSKTGCLKEKSRQGICLKTSSQSNYSSCSRNNFRPTLNKQNSASSITANAANAIVNKTKVGQKLLFGSHNN